MTRELATLPDYGCRDRWGANAGADPQRYDGDVPMNYDVGWAPHAPAGGASF